jgi:hypothetical protein
MADKPAPPGTYSGREAVERLREGAADAIREQLAEDQGAPPGERDDREPAMDAVPPSPVG